MRATDLGSLLNMIGLMRLIPCHLLGGVDAHGRRRYKGAPRWSRGSHTALAARRWRFAASPRRVRQPCRRINALD